MRMGPFSTPQVIKLLNGYFVPVKATTEEYINNPSKPASERELLREIWRRTDEKKFSRGNVHVYIVTPEGDVYASQHVRDATRVDKLVRLLRQAIGDLKASSGPKLVKESVRRGPSCSKDSLPLWVASEYSDEPGTVGEDWAVLTPQEWRVFHPAHANAKTWSIETAVARKILVHLYPFSQDWDNTHNKFEKCALEATVLSQSEQKSLVVIRGELLMHHNRYPNHTPQPVKAEVVGVVEFPSQGKPVFRLTTGEASYGGRRFDGMIVTPIEEKSSTERRSQDR